MEASNINFSKTDKNISTDSHLYFKKINSYNITGINEIHRNHKSENKNDLNNLENYKLSKTYEPKLIKSLMDMRDKNEQLNYVKNLIKKPENDKLYDGYACFRKKPTINYLLRKFDRREPRTIFEENKLCKTPYPLIKFLSNRKTPNHSKHLLTDMLSAEFNDLSIEQKNDIKYKNYKKPIKVAKLEYPEIVNKSNILKKVNYLSEPKNYVGSKYYEFPSLYTFNTEKIVPNKNLKKSWVNGSIYNYLNNNRPTYNDRSIKKGLMRSYCGDDVDLTEHYTFTNNIFKLKKNVKKILETKNEKYDEILKDISVLKSNHHIMPFESY